jgi:hypothetical protein
MASYDFVETSMMGYGLAWKERTYLGRLASIPLFIKFVCAVTVISLGWETDYFKQAIIMTPSYFAEGWLLSHMIRLIFLGQRWPFRPTGDEKKDMEVIEDRAHGIMAGTVTYALIQFLITGVYAAFANESGGEVSSEVGVSYHLIMVLVSFAFLIFTIWAFRFIWVYIPCALNYSLRSFARHVRGLSTSFYMLGTWMICSLPTAMVMVVVILSLRAPGAGSGAMITEFTIVMFQVLMTTVISIISTAGICYSIQELVLKSDKASVNDKSK